MAITDARTLDECEDEVEQLKNKLESMPVIEQAKGVLMATDGCTEDEAFQRLRRQSMNENRKVRDVGAEVVRSVQEQVGD